MSAHRTMQDVITLADRQLPVWPREQRVEMLAAPNVAVADFGDRDLYHAGLITVILEMERDPRYHDWIFQGGCGTKVRDPHLWGRPEADLIHARALRFASLALGVENVVVDDCWANVYRKGNYCMPHSHLRAAASLVYFLDPGDVDTEDPGAGRFYFCDPRIPFCCDFEEGRVTRLFMPDMYAGSLLIFPAQFVHAVNPYTGTRPRITMSWNISVSALPGDRSDGWSKREAASLDAAR